MRKAILKQLPHTVFIACMAMLFGCSAGTSSGGIYKQTFNVSGQWAGQIGDGNLVRNFTASLADTGTIIGNLLVSNHSCFAGATITDGTSTQAPVNTEGDNPLTTDQENSNEGTASITLTFKEADVDRITNMMLTGNSSSLTGSYSGFWISQAGSGGETLKFPGDETGLRTCRGGFEGSIWMVKL